MYECVNSDIIEFKNITSKFPYNIGQTLDILSSNNVYIDGVYCNDIKHSKYSPCVNIN